MPLINDPYHLEQYLLPACPKFPGNSLPVLHYKAIFRRGFFWQFKIRRLLKQHKWSNFHVRGILTYNHYHSNAHEVLTVLRGSTNLRLGGDTGINIHINQGDVLVLPAGTVHKNLGDEYAVTCLSAYHSGTRPDVNCGHPCERPIADQNIETVKLPGTDPVFGLNGPLTAEWSRLTVAHNLYARMHSMN